MPKNNRFKTAYPGVIYIYEKNPQGRREKSFYIRYHLNGKQIEEKVGRQYQNAMTPAKAARIRAQKIDGQLTPNTERREKQRSAPTIDQLFEQWKIGKAHLKSLSTVEYTYSKHLKEPFGSLRPEQIQSIDIERFKSNLLKSRSPRTVENILDILQGIINYCAEHKLCQALSFKIRAPKFDNKKTEFLTDDQLDALLMVLWNDDNKEAAAVMELALYTGMRKMEILGLKWDDIDYEKSFIYIRDPKGGVSEHIPMNDSARRIFKNLDDDQGSPYLFPARDGGMREKGSFRRPLRRFREAAGIPESFRPMHGLRHTYATILASSGKVDIYTLQRLLTHKDGRNTQRYAHLIDERLKDASNVIDDIFGD